MFRQRVLAVVCGGLIVAIALFAFSDGNAVLLVASWLAVIATVVAAIVIGVRSR